MASWEQHLAFIQMDTPVQSSNTRENLKTTEATQEFTSFSVSGLWTPSDVPRCTVSDEEDQRLHIKYPLRKEVEAGPSFIADTAHLSHPHGYDRSGY